MTENSFSIQLSREELVSLLNLLGIKGILGLGEDYLADFEEAAQRQILRAGANALRAKGWLLEEVVEGAVRLQVDSTILALLGVCMTAKRLLYVSHLRTDAPPRIWYVHLGESMTVIHRTTRPGVHELWASAVPAVVLGELTQFLQLEAAETAGDVTLSLPAAVMDQVVALAQEDGGETAVTTLLAESQIEGEAAALLATAVSHVQANSMVSLLEIETSEDGTVSTPVQTFSLLKSEQDLWLLATAVEDVSQLVLEQTSMERVQSALAQFI